MARSLYTNNAAATLNAAITSTQTTITLTSGQGALFPLPSGGNWFYATLVDAATQSVLEIVQCTARSTDTLTVVRGQQGTTANAYLANDRLELRPTATGFSELLASGNNLSDLGSVLTALENLGLTASAGGLLVGQGATSLPTWLSAGASGFFLSGQGATSPAFASVPSPVGSVRNLAATLTAAGTSVALTADEVCVEVALGGAMFKLPSYNKTLNVSTTGAGGMDTGSAPASGFLAIYAIYNPSTQTASILGQNATSAAAGNVYSGANMPAGYTASALLAVWPTNASSQLIIGAQTDRRFEMASTQILSTNSAGTNVSLSIAGAVPKNAKTVSIAGYCGATAVSNITIAVMSAIGTGTITIGGNQLPASGAGYGNGTVAITSQQLISYTSATSAGTGTWYLSATGYTI